uniref:Retrovirus-related Pol polyprotein from transposon TNT 1-94 n=1 Tax=Cajanus cajan TaxID=3821 RepID=A0A151R278_CAJCA|nr:hypothetical protein KK1_042228 [Cajanus cajan]
MKPHGDTINDQRIVDKILISLTKQIDFVVIVKEETKDLSTMNVHRLMGSLRSYEQDCYEYVEMLIKSAFQSKLVVSSQNDK